MKGILCKFVHFVASTPFNTYFVTTAYKATVPATNAYTIFNTPTFFDNDYHFKDILSLKRIIINIIPKKRSSLFQGTSLLPVLKE